MPPKTRLTADEAKEVILGELRKGSTNEAAARAAGKSTKTLEYYRKTDEEFRNAADLIRTIRTRDSDGRQADAGDFESFRLKYLQTRSFTHQMQWIDILEGREPREVHPAMVYEPGRKNRLLINTPPNHAKSPLALDTPILTTFGFKTMAEIEPGDQVFGQDGKPTTVVAKSPIVHRPCYRVSINDGESFVATEDHKWVVASGRHDTEVLTTRELAERGGKFKLPGQDALALDEVEYILDPYLLGVWLGDGHTASGRITSADPEVFDSFRGAGFEVSHAWDRGTGRAETRNVYGLFPLLAELGVKGRKFIPEGYLLGSYEQRQALLQGLMDTDGTINVQGGASFTSTNKDLAEGVWYLASSLGLRPSMREGRATLDGRDCGPKWTVWFSTAGVACFRLQRKLCRQVSLDSEVAGRGRRLRTIVSVEPTESVPAQCLMVDNDSHVFLVGKSLVPTHNTTITMDYVTYRVCKDPNVRVIVVSKTQEQAKKFLYGIKSRLTHPKYAQLQASFAPQGGFKESADVWTANKVYLGSDVRDSGEKDPTIEAIGMGGQIYGARADLIILDDCVTLSNAHEWEKQMDWLRQEVASRLGPPGKLLVVGTRVAPVDLYSELRNPDHYTDGKVPWTYFAQPAVLEQPEERKDWVTLWPRSDRPFEGAEDEDHADEDGLFPRWTAERLNEIRNDLGPSKWSLVYMQADVAEDQVFHPVCVRGSVNGMRKAGLLNGDLRGHPPEGMQNKYVICSLDPAVGGDAGWIALAADRATRKRYVLDAIRMSNPTPARIREQIQAWTEKYSPAEWRIEKNGLNRYITQDNLIRDFLATRGVVLREHFTGADKWDADYGVAGMAPLFGSMERRTDGLRHNKDSLIELPSSDNEGVKSLIEQLVTWSPGNNKHVKQDLCMALWFAEIRAREICNQSGVYGKSHLQSPLMSRGQRSRQVVVNLDTWQQEQQNRLMA